MLRVALPNKGRLSEDVKQLFDDAGLPIRGRSERSLRARIGDYEALFVRAQDIPEFVADAPPTWASRGGISSPRPTAL